MKDTKEIVYQAIREIADTEDAERWAVHNDICYDIAVRAVEIAMGEETKPITASWREVEKLSLELGLHHYRGIRIDTLEWVYGFLVIVPQLPQFWPPILDKTSVSWCNYYYIIKWEDNAEQYFRVYPESVGRCTGLTDKNGNAIWEGDIIRSFGTLGDRIIHEVKWSNDHTGFVAFNEYGSDCGHIEKEWIKEYEKEVIGNIFENPEWKKGDNNDI